MSNSHNIKSAVVKVQKRERSVEREFDTQVEQVRKRFKMGTTIVNFVGSIEHFTAGDDFKDYIERMEHIYSINATKETDKVSLLVSLGGPELYRIIKLVAAPKKPKDCTYTDLLKALNSYFEPKRNILGERFIFHRRLQGADETVSEFIVEIKSLSQTCDFDTNLDTALRDKLIFGVRSTKIQRKLVSEKELNFDKACELARMMEATENGLNEMQNSESVSAIGRNRNFRERKSVFQRLESTNNKNEKPKRFATYKCYLCQKMGHVVKYCFKNPDRVNMKTQSRNGVAMTEENIVPESSGTDAMNHINSVLANGPLLLEVSVNTKLIRMEVDTGACKSVIHVDDFNKQFSNGTLRLCDRKLFAVSGQELNIKGVQTVEVQDIENKNRFHKCELIVVQSSRNFIPLLGRDWLDILYPSWRQKLRISAIDSLRVESIDTTISKAVDKIKVDFSTVFASIAVGTIRHFKAKLNLIDEAKPIFFKPYTVPYGLREAVENEIKRLCSLGIIYPVRHSAWASPVVIVNKPDGSIRMCVDCKVTINKYLLTDHYPLPRMDDILASLANAKYFCVLDLREAYAQMEVAEEAQEFLTINTHMGLFRYKRLIFGVSCAPTIFQSMMDQIVQGLLWVICFIDDLLIGGETLEKCIENVRKCLERLQEYNVKIKWEKCKFFRKSVTYLGHVISGEGIQPNPEKVRAISDAPKPENLTQLKSFLGLINYYGRFIPNLSQELIELYRLTKKGAPFVWSEECNQAFEKCKRLLVTNDLLIHYDPKKPIVIHCDASPYGLGAILSHIVDGQDRPVLFTSCTLTKAQQNYAQLHREALAIVFAVKKFHKYIFGQKFTIYSDHQPLQEIFNEKKNTPIAAGRLQRWSIFLAMYNYQIEYKKGSKIGNADGLSRLPLQNENDIETENIHAFGGNDPINIAQVAEHTKNDTTLKIVYKHLMAGWKEPLCERVKPYHSKRSMLAFENDCIYYGNRLVIPDSLKLNILAMLHDTHIGVCRMKASARQYVWWYTMDRDIEVYVQNCTECQHWQATSSKTPLSKWKDTTFFFWIFFILMKKCFY